MSAELPPLAEFLRWLADLPDAFRQEPAGFPGGRVPLPAVVNDLAETLTGQPADAALLKVTRPANLGKVERNRLRWILAACHLLWHPAFRDRALLAESLRRLLGEELTALSEVVLFDDLLADEERREELIRRALRALGLRLPGEAEREAEDRLTQVDSVERRRLLREAAERERRAREVREAMARKAAEEAAARYSAD
jgi:hypothetical protein